MLAVFQSLPRHDEILHHQFPLHVGRCQGSINCYVVPQQVTCCKESLLSLGAKTEWRLGNSAPCRCSRIWVWNAASGATEVVSDLCKSISVEFSEILHFVDSFYDKLNYSGMRYAHLCSMFEEKRLFVLP